MAPPIWLFSNSALERTSTSTTSSSVSKIHFAAATLTLGKGLDAIDLKYAMILLSESMVMLVMVELPETSPDQWSKAYPEAGVTERVTSVPEAK